MSDLYIYGHSLMISFQRNPLIAFGVVLFTKKLTENQTDKQTGRHMEHPKYYLYKLALNVSLSTSHTDPFTLAFSQLSWSWISKYRLSKWKKYSPQDDLAYVHTHATCDVRHATTTKLFTHMQHKSATNGHGTQTLLN